MHATILKGIVGGFEFSFFQRNLKEFTRKAMEMCLRVLKESNKSRSDSYSRQVTVLIISHITFRDCHVHIFCDNLSRNSCMFWWSKGCQSLWPVIAVLSSLRCDFSLGAPATSSWRSPHQPLVAYYWPFDKLQYSGTPIQGTPSGPRQVSLQSRCPLKREDNIKKSSSAFHRDIICLLIYTKVLHRSLIDCEI